MSKLTVKNELRLAKFLASAGVASRRQAEALILGGQVKVNGKIITHLPTKIDPEQDQVLVKGKIVKTANKVYYLLHKPIAYLSSAKDPHHQKLVTQLVPRQPKVWPVGRLDKDSRGLLLLTNDGELTFLLTHPKHAVAKVYQVEVNKKITAALLTQLKKGIRLEEGLAKADQVRKIADYKLELTIHQGWNRQVRRMLAQAGYRVTDLLRTQEGNLDLADLAVGKYRILSREEIV